MAERDDTQDLADTIDDDVDDALNEDDEKRRNELLAAIAATAFALAWANAGGTGTPPATAITAFTSSLRPAFGLLIPDGSDEQVGRMSTVIAHAAVNGATLAVTGAAHGDDAKVEWRTMRDDRVRDLHRPLDGTIKAAGDTFDVGGHPLQYPGQPVGPPEVWINCRCVLMPSGGVTAAGDPPRGAVVVARPSEPHSLAVEGGLPPDELHVTLGYYGDIDQLDPDLAQMIETWATQRGVDATARVGGIARMGQDDPQAVVLLLESPALAELRSSLEGVAPPDTTHPHFTPHMTLGYGIDWPATVPTEVHLDRVEWWRGDERIGGDMSKLDVTGSAEPTLVARTFDTKQRKSMADRGTAMPDGSYPIANVEDLRNAIQAIGRAKDPDAVKRHIRKRARALGAENLIPDSWTASGEPEELAAAGPVNTHDAPGWITNPRETQRLRTYWTKGAGAGKIRWGAPGDFDRCRKQLAKYVQNPAHLAGTCANLHYVALGFWPGQPPHGRRKGRVGGAEETFDGQTEEFAAVATAFIAAAQLAEELPPIEWFQAPPLTAATPVTITDDDEFVAHLAAWDTCHVGISGGCTTPPHSAKDYAYFRTGEIITAGGPISVGQITMDTGHAGTDLGPTDTVRHYDDTGTVVADVAAGEDEHGIWVHGMLRPGITPEQRKALRAGSLSGDWRRIGGNLELVAALVVNVPGFPIPRTEMAASAGVEFALVAAGAVTTDPNALDVDRIAIAVVDRLDERERRAATTARVAALRASVNADRVADLVAAVEV